MIKKSRTSRPSLISASARAFPSLWKVRSLALKIKRAGERYATSLALKINESRRWVCKGSGTENKRKPARGLKTNESRWEVCKGSGIDNKVTPLGNLSPTCLKSSRERRNVHPARMPVNNHLTYPLGSRRDQGIVEKLKTSSVVMHSTVFFLIHTSPCLFLYGNFLPRWTKVLYSSSWFKFGSFKPICALSF